MNLVPAAILAAAAATFVVALVYAAECWLRPFARCWVCSGSGHGPSLHRPCRWCRGHRVRLRLGRRAFNHMHNLYRASGDRAAARGRS